MSLCCSISLLAFCFLSPRFTSSCLALHVYFSLLIWFYTNFFPAFPFNHVLIVILIMFCYLFSATCALVSSRDLHWSLHASKDLKDINLTTIRMLLLADRANPCEWLLDYYYRTYCISTVQ